MTIVVYLFSFILIALASEKIGVYFKKIKLPLITGFLFTGIVGGPYVLDMIDAETVHNLKFIDEMALSVIAFAAGNELYVKELRDRFKSITWITIGLVFVTFTMSAITIVMIADYVPFMRDMPVWIRVAVGILGGTILVARSPSSAIAIVNELRARGTFTKTALGVTMIMDVVVIVLFAVNSSIADAIITNIPFSLGFIGILLFELTLSLIVGFATFKILNFVLNIRVIRQIKAVVILSVGFGVFQLSSFIREYTHEHWTFEVLLEPLLICMIVGFLLTNYSRNRDIFSRILHTISPTIYILFFTLTGASLSIDVLAKTWQVALVLFAVRLVAIFIGSFTGGTIAGDPMKHNRLAWMSYITQAGVGLGLAKEVALEFPSWGEAFGTTIIAVIVLNQVIGPPLFKWVINFIGESHTRAQTPEFDGVRDVLIFGVKAQSVSLAHQLLRHDWNVKLVCTNPKAMEEMTPPDLDVQVIPKISVEVLRGLGADLADAIVSFLPDDQSYELFELAFENFGTETMVARLGDRENFEKFNELGVQVVEPQTAVVSLLEQFVLSPKGASLLLGLETEQELVDIEVCNQGAHGIPVRDMRLPLDVLLLSIHRNGQTIVPRGHTRIQVGDRVTMVGPKDKVEEVMLRLDPC